MRTPTEKLCAAAILITAASGVILPADIWFGSAALRREAKAGKTNAKPQTVSCNRLTTRHTDNENDIHNYR
jgi:hypothetical protein